MTFELSQVVTPEDLAEQMETLTQRLDAGEKLVLFQNNRPRFWLVGLEHLPQCSQPVPAGSAPTVAPKTGQDVKIGTLVRTELGRLCRQNALSAGMLQNLCNTSYCKPVSYTHLDVYKRQRLYTVADIASTFPLVSSILPRMALTSTSRVCCRTANSS